MQLDGPAPSVRAGVPLDLTTPWSTFHLAALQPPPSPPPPSLPKMHSALRTSSRVAAAASVRTHPCKSHLGDALEDAGEVANVDGRELTPPHLSSSLHHLAHPPPPPPSRLLLSWSCCPRSDRGLRRLPPLLPGRTPPLSLVSRIQPTIGPSPI